MHRLLALTALSFALLATGACAETPAAGPPDGPEVRTVSPDLEPLKDWFNENRGRPRLIVLLSPT